MRFGGDVMSNSTQLANALYNAGELSPGFDIEELVERLGGRIEYVWKPSIDAYIQKDQDFFKIVVDSTKPILRQRFSIAHEIGHLLLHLNYGNENVWRNIKEADSRIFRFGHDAQELEANEFAAELLMPKEIFKKMVKKYSNNGYVDLEKLSRYFRTSVNAVKYRGHNLKLWDMNRV